MIQLDQLEQEAAELASVVSSETINDISELIKRQVKLQRTEKIISEMLEKVRGELRKVSEIDLPQSMAEAGVSDFVTDDGIRVKVKKNYFPSIKDDDKEKAHQWLLDNGYDIIKKEVVLKFSKTESEQADCAYEFLEDQGFKPERKESIHFQTFRAWAKERMESGDSIPEFIQVHIVDKADVKLV